MPAKNSIKKYIEGGYYHIYNRGVEKRDIFLDEQDYGVFLSYLKTYLLPKNVKQLENKLADPKANYKDKDKISKLLRLNNFSDEISLLAYCLMTNHFHLMIKQESTEAIDSFMNSVGTRYTMYFNRKYKRVGPLYQGVYKAVLLESEEQFLHLSRYIHKQALDSQGDALRGQPSSLPEYLGLRNTKWIKPDEVLSYFSSTNKNLSYEVFVKEADELGAIKDVVIENP